MLIYTSLKITQTMTNTYCELRNKLNEKNVFQKVSSVVADRYLPNGNVSFILPTFSLAE